MRHQLIERQWRRRGHPAADVPKSLHDLSRVVRGDPSPLESCIVELDSHAVERDRLLDCFPRHRNQSPLPCEAHEEQVDADRVADDLLDDGCRRNPMDALRVDGGGNPRDQCLRVRNRIASGDEERGRRNVVIDDGDGSALIQERERVRFRGHHQITSDEDIGARGTDTRRVESVLTWCQADVAGYRAVLLREAGHVEDGYATAL